MKRKKAREASAEPEERLSTKALSATEKSQTEIADLKEIIEEEKKESFGDTAVLIPSFEPGEVLVLLAKTLAGMGFKVLVVDDGSGPEYAAVFEKCRAFAFVLSYPENRGKGYALRSGFRKMPELYPECRFIITADGDGQHRIIDIVRMAETIRAHGRPIIGDRNFDVRIPVRSKVGNDLSKFMQSLFTFRYLHDNQCGLRAFPASLAPSLSRLKGSRYEYEMNVVSWLQLKEMPYETLRVEAIYEDGNVTSHFQPVPDTIRIQGALFVAGLINFLASLIAIVLSQVFHDCVFPASPFGHEFSALSAFGISLAFLIFFRLVLTRPIHPFRMIGRTTFYEFLVFLSVLLSVVVLSRIAGIPVAWAYLIGLVVAIFPLYELVKGIGLTSSYRRRR